MKEAFDAKNADPQKLWETVQNQKKEISDLKHMLRNLETKLMKAQVVVVYMAEMSLLDPRSDQNEIKKIIAMMEPALNEMQEFYPASTLIDGIEAGHKQEVGITTTEDNIEIKKATRTYLDNIMAALADEGVIFDSHLKKGSQGDKGKSSR